MPHTSVLRKNSVTEILSLETVITCITIHVRDVIIVSGLFVPA